MHFDVQRVSTHGLAIALTSTMAPTSATAAERELNFRDLRAIDSGHIGIAVLTDGDETRSASSADFGSFVLRQEPS